MARQNLRKHKPSEPKCGGLLRLFTDYLDDDLSQALCRQVEEHIRKCKTCDCVMDTLRKTIALYKGLPEIQLPRKTRCHLDRLLRRKAALAKARG